MPGRLTPRHHSFRVPFLIRTGLVLAAALELVSNPAIAGNMVWTGNGPRAKGIEAIARDPLNPSRMWAASFGSGVYRSLDGGATWVGSRTGLTNTFVRAIAVNPQHPDSLFCGTNDGVWVSIDAGLTWTKVLSTSQSVRAIVFHPVKTATLYAAAYGLGVFKSINGGKTWSAINLGLVNTDVRDIGLDPTRPDTLFAATGTGGGIHRSLNGGLTWTQATDTTASLGAAEQVVVDPLNPSRVYAATLSRGVIKSLDGGTTWVRINRGLTSFRGRSLALADSFRYFGTADSGVYTTTLNDTLWHRSSAGLADSTVDAILAAGGGSPTVWAGTAGNGIYRSDSRGASWSQLDGGLLATASFALAVNPATHAVYDGTGFGDQFWKSPGAGGPWTRAAALFSHDSERDVVLDPTIAGRIYLAAYGAAVYRSDDDGMSWWDPDSLSPTLTNRFVRALVAVPGGAGHLFVGTGAGVFESTDGAATWVPRSSGFPPSLSVRALAVIPGSPTRLLAGSDSSGIYRSDDGGQSWSIKSVGLPSPFVHALLVDASNPLVVYAGTDSGVVRSANAGDSWSPVRTGLPAIASVRDVVQDPSRPQALFAAVFGSGVYETLDAGGHWFSLFSQTGLSNMNVRALAIDSPLQTIFAGTEAGVFSAAHYPLSVISGTSDEESPMVLRLWAWPSPLRGSGLAVRYAMPHAGEVDLAVFDVRGRCVRRLIARRQETAGLHAVAWDGMDSAGERVAAGIYLVRLDTAEGRRSAKCVVLK